MFLPFFMGIVRSYAKLNTNVRFVFSGKPLILKELNIMGFFFQICYSVLKRACTRTTQKENERSITEEE